MRSAWYRSHHCASFTVVMRLLATTSSCFVGDISDASRQT
jgi:hypothetical protein